MNKNFEDTGIVIQYIQQLLKERYNSDIYVNSEYYKTFDMNYGFAHYIAKYLQYMYPLLDDQSIQDYNNIKSDDIRSLEKPISILNYFLCDNNGNRLSYNPGYTYTKIGNYFTNPVKIKNPVYDDIYNSYMIVDYRAITNSDGNITDINITSPHWYKEYFIYNDPPLFTFLNEDTGNYEINNNIIFKLQPWKKTKNICELDDFVCSYLLGRTIGPESSMEDIYYAQKLIIQNEIPTQYRGIWCPAGQEETEFDMTLNVITYQKSNISRILNGEIFVTGYFDSFTESCILKDLGDNSYGILGL